MLSTFPVARELRAGSINRVMQLVPARVDQKVQSARVDQKVLTGSAAQPSLRQCQSPTLELLPAAASHN